MIVGRRIASQAGFTYSPALRAFAQQEERWSEALLDRYLAAPYRLVPKTSMAFQGIDDAGERADLIAERLVGLRERGHLLLQRCGAREVDRRQRLARAVGLIVEVDHLVERFENLRVCGLKIDCHGC